MGQVVLLWWRDVCGALCRARERLDSTLVTGLVFDVWAGQR
jgi:hypothetical protein